MEKHNDTSSTDCMIVINPHLEKNGKWNGEVSLKMVVDKNNTLDEEDFQAMLTFTRQICASVPLMEDNKLFRDATEKLAEQYLPYEDMLDSTSRLTESEEHDNVVHVNFRAD